MAEWQGKILHRSGEELRLQKTIDRFTVAPFPATAETQLSSKLDAEVLRMLPALGLVEFRVAPERLDEVMQVARDLPEVQFVSHVYEMDWNPGTPLYLINQVTVQFAETTDASTMGSIAHSLGLQVVKLVPGVPKAFVFEVTKRATVNPIKLVQQLMRSPQVVMAEPNVAIPIRQNTNVQAGESDELLLQEDVEATRELTRGDRSTVITIAEPTMKWNQPGLQGMGRIVAPLALTGQPMGELEEMGEGRGAPVQPPGSNLQTLLAVASDCALMPIATGDVLDDAVLEQVCQGAIDQGASVLMCGWSADAVYFPFSLRQRVALSRVATQGRGGKGCVVVVAVGDDGHSAASRIEAMGESQAEPQTSIQALNGFAVHPDVICVAASPQPDRALPGNLEPGISVCAASDRGSGAASAIVAGVSALMLSVNPNLTAEAVRRILQDTADRIPVSTSQLESQPDGYNALGYSWQSGYGQVNALRAVEAAWQSVKPLEIPDRWIEQQNADPLDIPDGDWRGGSSAIDIQETGLLKSIEISLDIAHSFMGDLEIFLISPQGTEILLQNRALGRITRLRKTYNTETTPLLQRLLDQPVTGQWHLKVLDRVTLHTGQLQQWQLKIGLS